MWGIRSRPCRGGDSRAEKQSKPDVVLEVRPHTQDPSSCHDDSRSLCGDP
ncbi:unnamed protein product [Symbiodinium sp. KB8]|nr:unnamed protein product [Symbiodinium sp. KB8]